MVLFGELRVSLLVILRQRRALCAFRPLFLRVGHPVLRFSSWRERLVRWRAGIVRRLKSPHISNTAVSFTPLVVIYQEVNKVQ